MRIAIADDHPITLLGLRTLVRDHLGEVDVIADATSGRQLLEILATHPCTLCITSFFMPLEKNSHAIGGLNLVRALLRDFPSVPVVVLTTVRNIAVIRSMFIEGVCAVADKASFPTEIMHAVQASMAGRRFMSESLRDPELPLGHTGTSIPDKLTAMPVLSPCEADILRWLARGWIVSEIARHTRRSVKTISQHKQNAMRKLGVTCDYALFEYMLAGGALGAPAQQRAAVNTSYDPSIRTA